MRPLAQLVLALALLALVGCRSREPVPELLTVLDVGPRVVTTGDQLEVVGSGFLARRDARVTLTGTIRRPGHEPESGVTIDAQGVAESTSKLHVPLSDAVVEQACGKGDAATHATFRGDVEIAFPAATPGALPVTGTIHDVTLDLRPKERSKRAAQADLDEGGRVLALVGLKVADEPAQTGGLVVLDVEKDAAADQAGIAKGDVLVTLDGWSILDQRDVLPSGRHRFVTFGLQRSDAPDVIEREVVLRGYKPRASSDLVGVALVLGTAAAALLFAASPFARALTWTERWVQRRRKPKQKGGIAWLVDRLYAFVSGDPAKDPLADTVPAIAFLAASALACALPFGKDALGVDPDIGSPIVLGIALAVASALAGGVDARGLATPWKLRLRAAGWSLAFHVPTLLALACVVVLSGSMLASDAVHAQGGMPWHWAAFRTPFGIALAGLALVPSVLDVAPPRTLVPDADAGETTRRGPFARALATTSGFLVAMLVVVLWLGGWAIPFVDRVQQDRSFGLQAMGALLFLAKSWGLTAMVGVARETIPTIRADRAGGAYVRMIVPAMLAAAALTAGWTLWDPAPIVRRALGLVAFGAVVLVGVHVARRIAAAARSGAGAQVSPFLLGRRTTDTARVGIGIGVGVRSRRPPRRRRPCRDRRLGNRSRRRSRSRSRRSKAARFAPAVRDDGWGASELRFARSGRAAARRDPSVVRSGWARGTLVPSPCPFRTGDREPRPFPLPVPNREIRGSGAIRPLADGPHPGARTSRRSCAHVVRSRVAPDVREQRAGGVEDRALRASGGVPVETGAREDAGRFERLLRERELLGGGSDRHLTDAEEHPPSAAPAYCRKCFASLSPCPW